MVFLTVAGGVAHMGDLRRFGRVGGKALLYFEVVSTVALALGIGVGLLVGPGRGLNSDPCATPGSDPGGGVHPEGAGRHRS